MRCASGHISMHYTGKLVGMTAKPVLSSRFLLLAQASKQPRLLQAASTRTPPAFPPLQELHQF